MIKKLKLNSRGDTIIEILLSIAILSMVLSVSYGLANRSSQATRQAQERSEAQKFAEEQLELLRSYVNPDRPWPSGSDNRCFPIDDPATTDENESSKPTEDVDKCWRGPVDPNDPGSNGRYRMLVEPVAENTYTVRVDWANARGAQDELTLSYKLPVTGDIFDSEHRECSDNENNNPANDDAPNLIDKTDPDCWDNPSNPATYNPDREPEDPAPPLDTDLDGIIDDNDLCPTTLGVPPDGCPLPFVLGPMNGSSYNFCAPDHTLILPIGDGYDGCFKAGGAMYAWRNTNFTYSLSNGLKRGNATIKVCYQNYSTGIPGGYEGYKLKITAGHGRTTIITLPASQPCYEGEIFIDEVNPSILRLIWFNDAWVGGDANLQINNITITQKFNEGSSPASQAINGKDYTSCQLGGHAGYCILSDALYKNSVYSLSSEPSNLFRTQYKFNSSITPGNYDLSISYFNGDYSNLPAPPGYSYNVTVSYPGGSKTVNLPIENNLESRHIRQSTISNINITGSSPTVTIQWNNDYYNPGVFDANFGINSVLLTKR